jgi:hypothetical protein
MDEARLNRALEPLVGSDLAQPLAVNFVNIRRDLATRTLERSSPGKFVETFVQSLQYIATGKYDVKPDVDVYLSQKVENATQLPEGLRICGARIARAMYSLRNKRSIAHKNEIDPNTFDLAFVHEGAAWIMAELFRIASGLTMQQAGELVDLVQAPVGTLVEEIDGIRLVHADLTIEGEILVLLHSQYPQPVPVKAIEDSLKARSVKSVRNRLGEMKLNKLIHGDITKGYRLTHAGHAGAVAEIKALTIFDV